ncbi:MAG: ADP-glyceromanno-heptose 6-epimerase [Ignavibacteria bacterium]|nr:ADP-glyceromanno-heptose 6-epimerase [Ignavibacteria bacterium]
MGRGFIGSAVVWRLNQLGIDDIIIVDDFDKDKDSIKDGSFDEDKWKNLVHLRYADIFDKEDFGHMLSSDFLKNFEVETVFHLGANSSTTEKDFGSLLRNNYEYTKYLCEKALDNNVRFIYASSAATYGDGANGYEDNEEKLNTLVPLNGYGYSKHMFDLWAKKLKLFDKIVGLKYFNVYGPNEYHKGDMRSVVNKCFHQIKETGKARLFKSSNPDFGDGEQSRDFLYVKDAVEMTLFFRENKIVNGIYNIGTGESNSFNEFVKPVFKALNIIENIEYFDMPEILREKYQYYTKADISKLRKAGYDKGIYKIEDAVTDYVGGYLNAEDAYLS